MSPSRSFNQAVRLQVEVAGCSITFGKVNVFSSSGSGVAGYVVQDRTLTTKWSIQVDNGILSFVATSNPTSDEPIFEDSLVPGAHWRLFIDDGVMGIESTVTVQDDVIVLGDLTTATDYQLIISDGIPGIQTYVGSTKETFNFTENGVKGGTVEFSTISGITISGIDSGEISIKAISKFGQPITQLITVQSNVPVRFYSQTGRVSTRPQGQEQVGQYRLMVEPDVDIQTEDLVYPISGVSGISIGIVNFSEKIFDFDGLTHHTEADLILI
jgi:hypothetical protein